MPAINFLQAVLLLSLLTPQSDPLIDGIAHFQRGEYSAAETDLQQAVETQDAPRARAFLALSRAANGKCELASGELKEQFAAIADRDLRRMVGLGLVQCYTADNRFLDALGVLDQLRKLYPADPDVLYQSARLYMDGWNDTVHKMYQETPASFRVNQISGEILDSQGKYLEAVEQFRKAIAKSHDALDLHFRAGRALLMSSHSPETLSQAKQEFEEELKLNPSDAAAEYEVSQILLTEQEPDEALSHLERAVELNRNFPEALISLAKVKMKATHNDEAIALLERAVKLSPSSEPAHYSLMMAYRNAGRNDDSVREKVELEKLQRPPDGEFTQFLRKLGEKVPEQ